MDNNKKPLLIPPLDNTFLHVDILVWPKGKNGVVKSHINPTFLASRLRKGILSQSFDHYPRSIEWNQVSYA